MDAKDLTVILIDWNCREYRQITINSLRAANHGNKIKIVWADWYVARPVKGCDSVFSMGSKPEVECHRLKLYNWIISQIQTPLVCCMDADTLVDKNWIDSVFRYDWSEPLVVHWDQIRMHGKDLSLWPPDKWDKDIKNRIRTRARNWDVPRKTTTGFTGPDLLHDFNWGACAVYRKADIERHGGFGEGDEHGGWFQSCFFELTFRMLALGEMVKRDPTAYLYHAAHPYDWKTVEDSKKKHDGRWMPLAVTKPLDARGWTLPVVGITAYNRPKCLRRLIDGLKKTRVFGKARIVVFDDGSDDEGQEALLSALEAEVIPWLEIHRWGHNLGSNGNHQRFLDYFKKNMTAKWIVLEDDFIPTGRHWFPEALAAMDTKPHLYLHEAGPHPHGIYRTGTYALLEEENPLYVGPYDLKAFPVKYGDAHADWTYRAMRKGVAMRFDVGQDFQTTLHTPGANEKIKNDFAAVRNKYDAIVDDETRKEIPWSNGDLSRLNGEVSICLAPAGTKSLSLILPTYNRPREAALLVTMLRRSRCPVALEKNLVYTDAKDLERIHFFGGSDILSDWKLIEEAGRGGHVAQNKGLMRAAGAWVIWWNDDAYPEEPDTWLEMLCREIETRFDWGEGLIGFDEWSPFKEQTRSGGRWAAFGAASKRFLVRAKLIPSPYKICAFDNEAQDRAVSLGKYHYCGQIRVIHDHTNFGHSPDRTADQKLLETRRIEWLREFDKERQADG